MTNNDPLARCALFVAFEGMGLLDLTGPLTVFWSASKFMEQRGQHGYARYTVSLDGGPRVVGCYWGGRLSSTRGFSAAMRSPSPTWSSGRSQKNVRTQLL